MDLRYPIGKANLKAEYTMPEIRSAITEIEAFPTKLEAQLAQLTSEQLAQPYRSEGWTGNQVVHHVADSHIHAYTRTKFAYLTDGAPIQGYEEADWALTPEVAAVDIQVSVDILKALHMRWSGLWKAMVEEDFKKSYLHSEGNRLWSLGRVAHLYAWHGNHHIGHLKLLEAK